MNRSTVTRKLAAILIADVVGFSRHMERDEAGAFERLRGIRARIVDPKIAEHGGRVVKTAGDGMLLEFGSADAALRCAIDVQRAMAEDNRSKQSEERIEFRIGINLGDVIVDGNDIAGDGVNVAARLEALAEPGGICVSAAVREQVHGSLDVSFDDIGEQQVKNILRPIRVYRVVSAHAGSPSPRTATRSRSPHRVGWRWWAGGFASVVVVGIGAWLYSHGWWQSPSPPTAPALSVAVMPFTAPGGNAADQQLADDFGQDLTETLGRTTRSAWIVSPGLAATYKGKSIDPRIVGRELNVQYLVEGELSHSNNRAFVTARLIDTTAAVQQWSGRVELDSSKSTMSRDDLLPKLVPELRDALFAAESRRAIRQGATVANATDLALRALAIGNRDTSLDAVLQARKLHDEALQLDPNLTLAVISRAWLSFALLQLDPQANRVSLLREMDDLSLRAVTIDRHDPRAWDLRAMTLIYQEHLEAALEAHAEALRLDPYRAASFSSGSFALTRMGRAGDAVALVERGISLGPRGQVLADLLVYKCLAHLWLGQYDEAVAACEKGAGVYSDWGGYLFLTAAYAQKGDAAKAANAKEQLLKYQPGYSIARVAPLFAAENPIYEQQREATLVAGLRKAGIPEK